jgi:hypothetical protein
MEIILASIAFAVIWFVVSIGWNIVKSVHPTSPSALKFDNNKGYAWFFGLVIVNLIITAFIVGFYYYKTRMARGLPGLRGYPGQDGGQIQVIKD